MKAKKNLIKWIQKSDLQPRETGTFEAEIKGRLYQELMLEQALQHDAAEYLIKDEEELLQE